MGYFKPVGKSVCVITLLGLISGTILPLNNNNNCQVHAFSLGAIGKAKNSFPSFSTEKSQPKRQVHKRTHLFSSINNRISTSGTGKTPTTTSSSNNGVVGGVVNPNTYNVDLDTAVNLITASVQQENSNMRKAGIPFIDVKSKDYFVDDVDIVVSRVGGMGMELLELAGGRDDGFGITIVTKVSGNAEKAGIIPGDSIAAITITSSKSTLEGGIRRNTIEETTKTVGCECLDFDRTMNALVNFPSEDTSEVTLSLKRIRRWPKVKVSVLYPPVQVAAGVDNKEELELFAGENLRRALLNRGIIFEDPLAPKCDFCGGKCTVSVTKGMKLLSPMGMTESKIMAKNPTCRISCKTVVAPNMEEGDISLKVNVRQWKL